MKGAMPQWVLRFRFLIPPLLIVHLASFARTVRYVLRSRAPAVVLEPPDLAKALRSHPVPRLSAEDLGTLERDGVVRLRGVLNASMIKTLEPLLWDHAQEGHLLHPPYYFNGAVRALLRDGPLGSLAADAMGSERVTVGDGQVWAKAGGHKESLSGIHSDERWAFHRGLTREGLVTVWVAITDAPDGLWFAKGSHKMAAQIYAECTPLPNHEGRPAVVIPRDCIRRLASTNLTKQLGYDPIWVASADAGDIYIFYSHLLHSGFAREARRTALCFRMHGGRFAQRKRRCLRDQSYKRENDFFVFPPSEVGEVDCLPWLMVPELGGNSPVHHEVPTSLHYWLNLWALHVMGRATFLQRTQSHSLPLWRDL